MTLEKHLVRSRWVLNRLGVESFTELKPGIESASEGPGGPDRRRGGRMTREPPAQ